MKKFVAYPIHKVIKGLIKNMHAQNRTIFVYFTIYTITAAVYPLFAIMLPKFLIEELSMGGSAKVRNIILIVSMYFVLTAIFGFVKAYSHDYAYPRITRLRIDYIRDMYDKLLSVDYKYMEDASFFEVNNKAFEAVSSNNNGIEGVYYKLFESFAVLLTSIVLVVFIGGLNIFVLLAHILNVFCVMWINRKVHNYHYEKRKELSHAERRNRYYYNTTHDFGFGKDIRIHNLKDRILRNYDEEIKAYIGIHRIIRNKEFLIGFAGLAALLISDAATYGILVVKALNGMPIADFLMYLSAIVSLSMMLKTLIDNTSFIINEGQYVHDFYEFMDKDLGVKGGERKAVVENTLEIELRNVSFKYPNTDNYIFKNLNLKIRKGEKLAVVGINGAGKSTLVKLITGLFDVTEGEILINGIPIGEFDKKELYSMFSVVPEAF